MFHHSASPQADRSVLLANPFLKRAALFGGALLLLWLAFQLLPSSGPDPADLYSDTSGTIASKPEPTVRAPRSTSAFRPGYFFAVLLLGSGAGFAFYLRKRNGISGYSNAPIRIIGAMQMAPGQHLRLVSCGGEILLLGVTSSQITLLKTFPAEEFQVSQGDSPLNSDSAKMTTPVPPISGARSFASLLQQFSGIQPVTPQSNSRNWPA